MTWKLRGMSIVRQAFGGRMLENLKSTNVMSTWQKCEEKTLQQATECCPAKNLFDEAPVPEGSWSENYKRKDAHDNQMLFLGVTSFIITCIVFQRTDIIAKGFPNVTFF